MPLWIAVPLGLTLGIAIAIGVAAVAWRLLGYHER